MKFFKMKSYSVLTIIGFTLTFFFFFAIMLQSERSLPNPNWSREMQLSDFSYPSSAYISSQYKIYDCIPYEEGLLLSFVDEKGIHLQILDSDLNIEKETLTPYQTSDDLRALHLTMDHQKQIKLALYTLQDKKIDFYDLEQTDLRFVSSHTSIPQVEQYSFADQAVFYIKDHQLQAHVGNESFLISKIEEADAMTSYRDDDLYSIFTIEKMQTKRFLIAYTFNTSDQGIVKTILKQLPSDNSIAFQNLAVLKNKDKLYAITVLRNAKTSFNIADLMVFDAASLSSLSSHALQFSDYIPDPTLFTEGDQLKMGYIDSYQLGRTDVSRKYSSYPNYAVSTWETDQLTSTVRLTKTENTKINPRYMTLKDESVLVWMEYTGDRYVLYASSNNPSHLARSLGLNLKDVFGVFMNSITTYFPALYASMVLIFSVLVPVIVIYGMLSFFKITWVERHGERLLIYMIILHILIKFYFFIPTIHLTLKHMTGLNFFYATFTGQVIYSIGLTGLSLASFMLYRQSHRHVGAFIQYLRFSLLDCLLLISAFYPLYFV